MQRFMCRAFFHLTLLLTVKRRGRIRGSDLTLVLGLYGRGRIRGNLVEGAGWKTIEQSWKRFVKVDSRMTQSGRVGSSFDPGPAKPGLHHCVLMAI